MSPGFEPLSYAEFGILRLASFVAPDQVVELKNWEYLDRIWTGEALGFSEWLRGEETPEVLGSLAIDFLQFEPASAAAVLSSLRLPLHPGMSAPEVIAVLGDPRETVVFTPDRQTLSFQVGSKESYTVSCTIKHLGGLVYLTVLSHEWLAAEI